MEQESELTVKQGLKKFVSPLRLIGIVLIWFYLQTGPGLKPDALNEGVAGSPSGTMESSKETNGGISAAPAFAPTWFSVDRSQAVLREGAVFLNGRWDESPVLASIGYFFMHCAMVTMMIALILLGKRREPSRGQMTAAYWTGLAIGGALWTVHWGYLLWWGYVAVFVTNTGLMTQVVRYSATGRAAVAERARKSS